jgi:hypothetical protein
VRTKPRLRKFAIAALILGLLALVGWIALSRGVIYTGMIYRCARPSSATCDRESLVGTEVYLVSSFFDQPSPSTVLQVTRTDATGRFWFLGAPPGAVAAVRVGNYAPNTLMGTSESEPFCTFAFNGWGALSHDIEIYYPDEYNTVIGDHGGLYMTLTVCPRALR